MVPLSSREGDCPLLPGRPACRRTSAASKPGLGSRSTGSWCNGPTARHGLERGRKIRFDATAVESPIPYPLDSQLLCDSVRVLTRLLRRLARHHKIVLHDHQRRAKRRCLEIKNRRGQRRLRAYRDLLKVARKTAHYATMALQRADRFSDLPSQLIAGKFRHYWDLTAKIIAQTERRVLRGNRFPPTRRSSLRLRSTRTSSKKKGDYTDD